MWMTIAMIQGCAVEDSDGQEDTNTVSSADPSVDADGDGFSVADGDCDDTDPLVAPGFDEVCDGVDQDCNGTVDDAPVDGDTYYRDDDGDGYGDDEVILVACARPYGYSHVGGDCDDRDKAINPDAKDDGTDRNCDGELSLSEIETWNVVCSPDGSTVDLSLTTIGLGTHGRVFMADVGNSVVFGEEHDLAPVDPNGDGRSTSFRLTLATQAPFNMLRPNVNTIFNCPSFFDENSIMAYVFAVFDQSDQVVDCIGVGSDVDVILGGGYADAGVSVPGFAIDDCRDLTP